MAMLFGKSQRTDNENDAVRGDAPIHQIYHLLHGRCKVGFLASSDGKMAEQNKKIGAEDKNKGTGQYRATSVVP